MAWEGQSVTHANQHRPVMVPYLTVGNMNSKAGAAFGDRASAGAVSLLELAGHALRHAPGHSPAGRHKRRRQCSILYRLVSGMGRTLMHA
jgi:hypothetical protein